MKNQIFTYFIEIESGNSLKIPKKWPGFRDINEIIGQGSMLKILQNIQVYRRLVTQLWTRDTASYD
jgi:hypothetical protein